MSIRKMFRITTLLGKRFRPILIEDMRPFG